LECGSLLLNWSLLHGRIIGYYLAAAYAAKIICGIEFLSAL
jgi:hypothetical protein